MCVGSVACPQCQCAMCRVPVVLMHLLRQRTPSNAENVTAHMHGQIVHFIIYFIGRRCSLSPFRCRHRVCARARSYERVHLLMLGWRLLSFTATLLCTLMPCLALSCVALPLSLVSACNGQNDSESTLTRSKRVVHT